MLNLGVIYHFGALSECMVALPGEMVPDASTKPSRPDTDITKPKTPVGIATPETDVSCHADAANAAQAIKDATAAKRAAAAAKASAPLDAADQEAAERLSDEINMLNMGAAFGSLDLTAMDPRFVHAVSAARM